MQGATAIQKQSLKNMNYVWQLELYIIADIVYGSLNSMNN